MCEDIHSNVKNIFFAGKKFMFGSKEVEELFQAFSNMLLSNSMIKGPFS